MANYNLKLKIIEQLSKDPDKLHESYINVGGQSYTRFEVITALQDNTQLGEQIINNIISLTVDLLDRKKIKQ